MAKDKDLFKDAEELGIKKENLEVGLKKDKKAMEKMIADAKAFMAKRRR